MATFPESTSQGNPFDGNPSHFPSFGNIGAPYMAMLSLPRLTIGLPVRLFSTFVVLSVQTSFQPSYPPPKQHQPNVDPKVDPFPSSPISSPHSFSSPGESLDSSNQEVKKKKKRSKKKKQNKQGGNQVAIAMDEKNE